jgi:tetratricopeptide (TPR) repeat protein
VIPLGPMSVKGLPAPIEVYEVTGAAPPRSRFQAAAVRGLTRFVGRQGELEQLRQALERTRTGHGQVVAVVGEPGVGKSRLFWEFIHSHRTHGRLVLESGSASYGKATPYLPVIDLLKAYCQIESRDDGRKIREKLTGKLLALDQALAPALPALLALLDVPVEDAQWQSLDPPQRRQRTLEALKRLFFRESQVQPLCVATEDLHWIDSETQGFLDGLIESLPTACIVLLVNYRPEYQHGWGGKTYYTQLRLDPLPLESAEELLQALLGDDPALRPLKQRLIAQTQGNPFFLEESIRTLVETQVLVGERGTYRLAQPFVGIQVPATVQAVLAARIDRLPPEAKRLLQAAAVIGEDVPFALLQAIAEEPEEVLRHSLARLQTAEFLYEARLFPDLEYTFKHGLTHQVAYGSLLQDRRRALHGRIVEAIETLYPDRLTEHVERLAHHASRGELWESATRYLRQAGAKAFTRSANREAVAYFVQALAALSHLPETRETLERAVDLRFDLRNSLFLLGDINRMLGYLREAERLARKLDEPQRLGWTSVYMNHTLLVTGDSPEARRFGESAQSIAETLRDFPLQIAANLYFGAAWHATGDYRRAQDFLSRVLQWLDRDDLSRERLGLHGFPAVIARCYLVWTLADLGEFDAGVAHGQQGIQIAEAVDHPYSLSYLCWALAYLHTVKGEFDRAVPLLERGLALTRDWNLPLLASLETASLGFVYARLGRVAEGRSLARQAISAIESVGMGFAHSLFVRHLAEACVLAGRLEDAVGFALRALTFARERGQRGFETGALHLLGEITSHDYPLDVEAAEGHYRQALVLATELGMRPLVAHCHLGLGKLYRRTGKGEQAHEHLTTATTMYREMDMRFWLEQTEAEMKELG